MTGPDHYAEAERLVRESVSWDPDERQTRTDAVVLAAAQVHATLALAAATVDAGMKYDGFIRHEEDWREAVKK